MKKPHQQIIQGENVAAKALIDLMGERGRIQPEVEGGGSWQRGGPNFGRK